MKKMMKGNVAISEAALRAGLQFYAGYPITPQTEIMEYLSGRMPQLDGRIFVQAESELSAIHMLFGASAVGYRVMTSSSGPGTALKQEGIANLSKMEYPAVIVNVARWGVGLGGLGTSQCDYLRDTRGGGNGGYRTIVLTPNSVQESADMMQLAFELSEKYLNPVVIMSEASIGQMEEPCELADFIPPREIPDWAMTGDGKGVHDKYVDDASIGKRLSEKYELMREKEQRWESYRTEDAEYVFVAIGLASRAAADAVDALREQGEKVGLIRPITIWPFPVDAFRELGEQVKGFISLEESDVGQMVEDVALASKQSVCRPVYLKCYSFVLPKVREIVSLYEKIKNQEIKAVM